MPFFTVRGPIALPTGGGGGGSPPSTALWGWWDAEHSYTETTGTPTTLITSDGAAIGSQIDRSGSGHHIYQTSAGAKPLYKTGIINSLPIARFDGSNDLFLGASAPSGNSFSIYAVVARLGGGNFAAIITNDDAGLSPRYLVSDRGGGDLQVFNGGWGNPTNALGLTYHLVAATVDNTGAFPVAIQLDVDTPVTNNVTGGGGLGTAIQVGSFFTGFWNGDIAEILFYTAVHTLSSGDGLLARQYLNTKYNLGLTI